MPLFSRRQSKFPHPTVERAQQAQQQRQQAGLAATYDDALVNQQPAPPPVRVPFTKRLNSGPKVPTASQRIASDYSVDSVRQDHRPPPAKQHPVPFQRHDRRVSNERAPFTAGNRSHQTTTQPAQQPRGANLFKRASSMRHGHSNPMASQPMTPSHSEGSRLPYTSHSYPESLSNHVYQGASPLATTASQDQLNVKPIGGLASLFKRSPRGPSVDTHSQKSGVSSIDRIGDDHSHSVELLSNWAQGNHNKDPRTARRQPQPPPQDRPGFGAYDYASLGNGATGNGANSGLALHNDWGSWSQLPPGRSSFAFSSEPSIRESLEESRAGWSQHSGEEEEDEDAVGQPQQSTAGSLNLPHDFHSQPFMDAQMFDEQHTVNENTEVPQRRGAPSSTAKHKPFKQEGRRRADSAASGSGDYFQVHFSNRDRGESLPPVPSPNNRDSSSSSGTANAGSRRESTSKWRTDSLTATTPETPRARTGGGGGGGGGVRSQTSPSAGSRVSRPQTPGIDRRLQQKLETYNSKVDDACFAIHNAALESSQFYERVDPLPSAKDLPAFMHGLDLDLLTAEERNAKSLDLLRHLVHLHLFHELNDCLDASGLDKSQSGVMKKAMERFKASGPLNDVLAHRALQTSLQLSTLQQAWFMHSRSVILTSLQSSIAFFLHWAGLVERSNDAGLHGYGKLKEARDALDGLLKLAKGVKESVGGVDEAVLRRGWFEVVTKVGVRDASGAVTVAAESGGELAASATASAASTAAAGTSQRPPLPRLNSETAGAQRPPLPRHNSETSSGRKHSKSSDEQLAVRRRGSALDGAKADGGGDAQSGGGGGGAAPLITRSLGLVLLPLQASHPDATLKQLLAMKKGHVDMIVEPQQVAIIDVTAREAARRQKEPSQESSSRLRDDNLSSSLELNVV